MIEKTQSYQNILTKHGVELEAADLLEWVKGFEQLAELVVSYEQRRKKDRGQDPPPP